MALTQDLMALRDRLTSNFSEEVKAKMSQATLDLARSGIIAQAKTVDDSAPDFVLPNATGRSVELRELRDRGAVVVSFYRGQWCPYCNLELRALQAALPRIQAAGATLVAISPQTPDNSLSTVEKNELSFEVLSDVGNRVARDYGLVFTVPVELRPIYENLGIDLPAHNGDDHFELPIPATYVITPNGTIQYAYVEPDYTQRLDPEDIIAALESLKIAA